MVTEKKKLFLQFVRYMEACITSRDWAKYSFLNIQPRVGWLLCENNQKQPNTIVFRPSMYKTPWEAKSQKLLGSNLFYAMVNSELTQL